MAQTGTNTVQVEDCISRQAAIDALHMHLMYRMGTHSIYEWDMEQGYINAIDNAIECLEELPSAQPDGIPLEWIDKHLEWLDNCDNDFAQLAKVSIKAMVELWKKDRI